MEGFLCCITEKCEQCTCACWLAKNPAKKPESDYIKNHMSIISFETGWRITLKV